MAQYLSESDNMIQFTLMNAASDPQEFFGVDVTKDEAQLKRAYFRLSLHIHPDKTTNQHANEAFKIMSQKYEVALGRLQSPEATAGDDSVATSSTNESWPDDQSNSSGFEDSPSDDSTLCSSADSSISDDGFIINDSQCTSISEMDLIAQRNRANFSSAFGTTDSEPCTRRKRPRS
jgi:DnaJ-class molecular chaperone